MYNEKRLKLNIRHRPRLKLLGLIRTLWDSLGAISIIWIPNNLPHMDRVKWEALIDKKIFDVCLFPSHHSGGEVVRALKREIFRIFGPDFHIGTIVGMSVWGAVGRTRPRRRISIGLRTPVHGITMQGRRVHYTGSKARPRDYHAGSTGSLCRVQSPSTGLPCRVDGFTM